MQLQAVNYLAVVAAAAAAVVIGFVWYSPPVFGKRWTALLGRQMQTSSPATGYILVIVLSLITAFVLAQIVAVTGAKTLADGGVAGILVWLGFVATVTASQAVFEGKPLALWTLNNGFQLVSYIVMGAILAAWR